MNYMQKKIKLSSGGIFLFLGILLLIASVILIEAFTMPKIFNASLVKYYNQTLNWTPCSGTPELECATMEVPVSWLHDDFPDTQIAVVRKNSLNKTKGTVILNSGELDLSPVSYLQNNYKTLQAEYGMNDWNFVSFDPRGIGKSENVTCNKFDDTQLPSPTDYINYLTEKQKLIEPVNKSCLSETHSGLANYLDTQSVARDMDLLRSLLGEAQLNYIGLSNGTTLGQVYSSLFPRNVGKMVLDGGYALTKGYNDVQVNDSEMLSTQLLTFVRSCQSYNATKPDSCPFTGSAYKAVEEIKNIYERANDDPIPVLETSNKKLNGVDLYKVFIYQTQLGTQTIPRLAQAFKQVINDKDASIFDSLSQKVTENYSNATRITACEDYGDMYQDEKDSEFERTLKESKTSDDFFVSSAFDKANEYICSGIPAAKNQAPLNLSSPRIPSIVVVATTGDPVTPYSSGVELADQYKKGVLLTYKSIAHVAIDKSTCISAKIANYFNKGKLPTNEDVCEI
jgi:pimeloyl-ACP methyl ester carboxylesterase